LAFEHCILPQSLISEEILPFLKESSDYIAQRKYSSVLYLLNGMGPLAKKWNDGLSILTSQPNLKTSTLLNWEGVIRPNDLVRRYKAWCPLCLDEWKSNHQVIYEPLIWCMKQVSICSKHLVYLSDICPSCKKVIPMLGSRSIPGYCSYCGSWLGSKSGSPEPIDQEDLWITERIQEMLTNNSDPSKATCELDGKHCLAIFDANGGFCSSSSEFLASVFGVHFATVNRWKRGENPTLPVLLKGCYLLQRSPFKFNRDLIEDSAIASNVSIGSRTNENESQIIKLFEEDQKRYLERYVISLCSSKSISDFYRRIGVRQYMIVAKCPSLHEYALKFILGGRKAKQNRIRELLKLVLQLNVTPRTLKEVANEAKIPIRSLRRYAPDLCKTIARRRLKYETQIANSKEDAIMDRVYKGTIELLSKGRYPTNLEISSFVPHPAYLRNPRIQKVIKRAVADFNP